MHLTLIERTLLYVEYFSAAVGCRDTVCPRHHIARTNVKE